jgi:hypothetical protein
VGIFLEMDDVLGIIGGDEPPYQLLTQTVASVT